MKYRTILLFGAPGAGKGTQGRVLGAVPNFFHCACGDVFRSLDKDTPLGKVFLDYSNRGELVPDGPTVELWRQFINEAISSGRFHPEKDTLLLDGIPRNVAQAELLQDAIEVRAILYLKSEDQEALIKRLQGRALKENRLDDADVNVIRNRLDTYDQETKPVLGFYDPKLIQRINADPSPLEVLADVVGRLLKL